MTRTRTILIVVLVFGLLAAFTGCSSKTKTGASNKAKELTDFNLGHVNSTSHLLGFVAAEEGFFREEGLDVKLIQLANGTEMTAALESGKLDAAFLGAVNTVLQHAAGHDVTIFGGAMSNGHGIVLKSKYIPANYKRGDITVLKGHNVSATRGGTPDFELQFLMKQSGIELGEGPDKINIVYFPSQIGAYNALAGDQIDGASVYTPYSSIAKNAGHTVVFYCNEISAFENHPCCRQIALTSVLAAKPELYIAFERAIIKAYKFSQENHEKTIEDVSKYITIDKKDIEYEVYNGYALSHPDPDKKSTFAWKKGIVELGYTDGVDYDLEKLYNLDIYKMALAHILAEYPNDPVYKSLEVYFNSAN